MCADEIAYSEEVSRFKNMPTIKLCHQRQYQLIRRTHMPVSNVRIQVF